jgi:hypothetical protein
VCVCLGAMSRMGQIAFKRMIKLQMRPLEQALIQSVWCPYKVWTHQETPGCAYTKEWPCKCKQRGLRGNQNQGILDASFQNSEKISSCLFFFFLITAALANECSDYFWVS